MDSLRSWIQGHFGVLLMCGLLAGLALPVDLHWAGGVVPIFLAIIIYFSCFKIIWSDLRAVKPIPLGGFYVVRFLLLPLALFYVAAWVLPDYKYALLLLLLLPSGATFPAVTTILGGNAVLALGMLALNSFLAPFVIPAMFALLSKTDMQVDSMGMLWTLTKIVFIPAVLYALTAKILPRSVVPMKRNASMVAVVLISLVALIIVSNYRQEMLKDIPFLLQATVIGCVVYSALYAAGWIIFRGQQTKERITYALMTGNNNIALGISLAFLYLPAKEISILVIWELAWLSGISAFQYYLSKRTGA